MIQSVLNISSASPRYRTWCWVNDLFFKRVFFFFLPLEHPSTGNLHLLHPLLFASWCRCCYNIVGIWCTRSARIVSCVLCRYIYIYICEAIGTAATPGLLCQRRVIVQREYRLAGKTEVLREILPQRHFCPSQNPTWPDPGLNPGRRGEKPATNRLSYGAAHAERYCTRANRKVFVPIFFPAIILVWLSNRVIHSMQQGMFGPAQH
jgi:hypothetical protein